MKPEYGPSNAKMKANGMNRGTRRKFFKDLEREQSRDNMPDMANEYRAKRRAKRLRANKTRNKNRRLSK